jgi:surfactin synthase thioesterase subunit
MDSLAEDLYWRCQDEILSGERYAILGHCMGAVLGTMLTKKILAAKLPPPTHLFVSGRTGPAYQFEFIRKVSALVGDEFMGWVKRSGSPFGEVLEDAEFAEFFEPVLRGDFQACENYAYSSSPPVPVPITVLYGKDENMTPAQLLAWQQESSRPIKTYGFTGGHFFIYDHFPAIALLISHSLSGYHP